MQYRLFHDMEYFMVSRLAHAAMTAPCERQLLYTGGNAKDTFAITDVYSMSSAYQAVTTLALAKEHKEFGFSLDIIDPIPSRRSLSFVVVTEKCSLLAICYLREGSLTIQINKRHKVRLILPILPYPPKLIKQAKKALLLAEKEPKEWVH